jgi:hypothetical protein
VAEAAPVAAAAVPPIRGAAVVVVVAEAVVAAAADVEAVARRFSRDLHGQSRRERPDVRETVRGARGQVVQGALIG